MKSSVVYLKTDQNVQVLNKKILQIGTNIQSKYGEDMSIMDKNTNNIQTIKIEREK